MVRSEVRRIDVARGPDLGTPLRARAMSAPLATPHLVSLSLSTFLSLSSNKSTMTQNAQSGWLIHPCSSPDPALINFAPG
jgi:hypothetical protein